MEGKGRGEVSKSEVKGRTLSRRVIRAHITHL